MNQATLKKIIFKLPSSPGIYMFRDAGNKDLYIGKATNLKNRLGSYLKTDDSRIRKMVDSARLLKFISVQSDIEALIFESQMIKNLRPPFNMVMRDDKQYFYVGFTDEIFPKIFLTHQPWTSGACPSSPHEYSDYFRAHGVPSRATPRLTVHNFIGPFTDGNTLKSTLRFLGRTFPYCTCKQPHNNFCLNYHIGKCLGYCCLKKPTINALQLTTYQRNIRAIKDVLSGKRNSLVKKLEKEMGHLAKNNDLERAIELRNKISDLKRVFENARVIKKFDILKARRSGLESLLKQQKPIIRIEGYDVSNIQGAHATGSMVTFIHGQPDKNFYRKFKIYAKETPNDTAMLKEILERRFRHDEWPFPNLILIDGGKGQVNTARATLADLNISIPVIGVSKNERHLGHQLITCLPAGRSRARFKIIPLNKLSPADKNLLLAIDSEAHRFAISYYRKLHRKKALRP